jgi:choline dehydrogenase-like flavoprotein
MSEALKFDAIVVGAGQEGPSLADRLARAGKRVAFVERHAVHIHPTVTELIPTLFGDLNPLA